MLTLKRIDVLSAAKIYALLMLIFGIVLSIFIGIANGALIALGHGGVSMFMGFGLGFIAFLGLLPILMLVAGFVLTAIDAWLYNVIAGRVGGIKIDLTESRLRRIDLMSLAKIYAVGGIIVGVIAGVVFTVFGIASGSALSIFLGVASIFIFGAAGFIIGALFTILYNFLAAHIGGVMLYIEGNELKSIGIMSYAKIEGIIGLVVGFIEGFIYTVINEYTPYAASAFGPFAIVIYPLIGLVGGFLGSLFIAFLYNWLSRSIGGIKFVLS
ncbi:MAG: hypothetical protein ACREBH_00510 [Candidatus Micrarchaeaceae archaeon]